MIHEIEFVVEIMFRKLLLSKKLKTDYVHLKEVVFRMKEFLD